MPSHVNNKAASTHLLAIDPQEEVNDIKDQDVCN
jgi:hypothetical protein